MLQTGSGASPYKIHRPALHTSYRASLAHALDMPQPGPTYHMSLRPCYSGPCGTEPLPTHPAAQQSPSLTLSSA